MITDRWRVVALICALIAYLYVRLQIGVGIASSIASTLGGSNALAGMFDSCRDGIQMVVPALSVFFQFLYGNRIIIYIVLLPIAVSRMQTRSLKSVIASFQHDVSPFLRWLFIVLVCMTIVSSIAFLFRPYITSAIHS
jgi:hypothetical protein